MTRAIPLRVFHDLRASDASLFPFRAFASTAMLRSCACSVDEVRSLLKGCDVDSEVRQWLRRCSESGGLPVHVLVREGQGTRNSQKIRRHRSVLRYPRGSFIKVEPHVFVCAPELVFVQMAARLSFGELLALGYELCGCYSVGHGDESKLVRRPLTSPARLVAFCSQIENARGAKVARAVAAQILAKSGSPMETELAIAAFTSVRRGGLGVEPARLNEPIELSRSASHATGLDRVVGDCYWRDAHLVIEYDGREAHSSDHQRVRDSRKRDALMMDGIDLVTITAPQLRNVTQSISLLDNAARRIGKPKRARRPEHMKKHLILRAQAQKYHRECLGGSSGWEYLGGGDRHEVRGERIERIGHP